MYTQTFIKMVSKADEIQNLCKYNKGNWYIDDNSNIHVIYWNPQEYQEGYTKQSLGNFKWLPTLEDLFGIWSYLCQTNNSAHPEYLAGTHLPSKFIERINEEMVFRFGYFDKEFCLKIIMEDFYNKSWNGKGWEVIN
jgi:hypothetical protein